MKDEFDYPTVDLYSIGKEMIRASKFEEKYYEMEKDRDYWKDEFWNLIKQGQQHNKEMLGGLLDVALKMGEDK